MKHPIPYGKKVLVKREKKEESKSKIILSTQINEVINKGEIVCLPSENLNLNVGDIISFEYDTPSRYECDDGYEYVLVQESNILLIYKQEEPILTSKNL